MVIVGVSEPFVVDAQAMQDGGVEVLQAHRVHRKFPSDLVRFAVMDTALEATSGHPNEEAVCFFAEIAEIGQGI
jgi:hypothetical protein